MLAHGRARNVHVVVYKHVKDAPPYLPRYRFLRPAYVHPLNPARNWVYHDMHEYANAIVEVPEGETAAVVKRNAQPKTPPAWMPYWRGAVLGVPTAILVGAVDHVGPLGPVAAAVWLGLNFWLH